VVVVGVLADLGFACFIFMGFGVADLGLACFIFMGFGVADLGLACFIAALGPDLGFAFDFALPLPRPPPRPRHFSLVASTSSSDGCVTSSSSASSTSSSDDVEESVELGSESFESCVLRSRVCASRVASYRAIRYRRQIVMSMCLSCVVMYQSRTPSSQSFASYIETCIHSAISKLRHVYIQQQVNCIIGCAL
jgi:hypothetical protein